MALRSCVSILRNVSTYYSEKFPERNALYDELLAAGKYEELYDQISDWERVRIEKEVDQIFADMKRIQDRAAERFREEQRRKRQEEDRIRYEKMMKEEEERKRREEEGCTIC